MYIKNKAATTNSLHLNFMKQAIDLSQYAGIESKTGGCFGAIVVKDNTVIGRGYNQVLISKDPTWHAEMHAIKDACKNVDNYHLKNAVLYTSAKPCPMCLCACYWAHIDTIFYAATDEDVLKYGKFQDNEFWNEMQISEDQRKIKSINIGREEAIKVWKEYENMKIENLLPDY